MARRRTVPSFIVSLQSKQGGAGQGLLECLPYSMTWSVMSASSYVLLMYSTIVKSKGTGGLYVCLSKFGESR